MNARKQQSVTVPNDYLKYNLLAHHELQYIITGKIHNLEANIWIISTIEWQQHASVYVQESTKGVVSVIKTSCAHSVTLKGINKTPHSFMHF